jgi:DNA-binding transcriptional MerR regulator
VIGTYAISNFERATGVKPTTIRWYEQEGWLPPPGRTEGGHRANGETHLRRLGFIHHARELGFESHAIRALLDLADRPGADCEQAHALAMAQICKIIARLLLLAALRTELQRMATSCEGVPHQIPRPVSRALGLEQNPIRLHRSLRR